MKNIKSQAISKNNFRAEFDKNARSTVEKYFTETSRLIVNKLLSYDAHYEIVEPSQEHIADEIDKTREYVNKTIGQLYELGVLEKDFRWYRTCVYKVSSFFKKKNVIPFLIDYFPNLKYFYVAAFFSLGLVLSGCQKEATVTNSYTNNDLKSESLNNRKYNTIRNNRESVYSLQHGMVHEYDVRNRLIAFKKGEIMQGSLLTMAGFVELSCFHQRAVLYALDRLKKCSISKVRNPFAFLFSEAQKFSKANNLPIDYSLVAKMRREYGFNGTEERFTKTAKQHMAATSLRSSSYVGGKEGTSKFKTNEDSHKGLERSSYGAPATKIREGLSPISSLVISTLQKVSTQSVPRESHVYPSPVNTPPPTPPLLTTAQKMERDRQRRLQQPVPPKKKETAEDIQKNVKMIEDNPQALKDFIMLYGKEPREFFGNSFLVDENESPVKPELKIVVAEW